LPHETAKAALVARLGCGSVIAGATSLDQIR
jgi:hypothetical protein